MPALKGHFQTPAGCTVDSNRRFSFDGVISNGHLGLSLLNPCRVQVNALRKGLYKAPAANTTKNRTNCVCKILDLLQDGRHLKGRYCVSHENGQNPESNKEGMAGKRITIWVKRLQVRILAPAKILHP